MSTKKTKYNKSGIEKLPNDKPVMYKITTENSNTNYAGIAKKGRVKERIAEHFGEIPGAEVKIEQFSSIKEAAKKEKNVISRTKPKYNKQGK